MRNTKSVLCVLMQVDEEKIEEIKRQTMSAGDAEMDRGHKKKLITKTVTGRDNPGYNPFQECQLQRNTWTVSITNNGTNNNIPTPTPPQQYRAQIFRQNPHKHRFNGKFNRNGSNSNGRHFNKNHNNFQRQQPMNK